MVANSSNLIITVKPANQRTLATPRRGSFSRNSQLSSGSQHTNNTNTSDENDHDDQDEVTDLTTGINLEDNSSLVVNQNGVLHLWNDCKRWVIQFAGEKISFTVYFMLIVHTQTMIGSFFFLNRLIYKKVFAIEQRIEIRVIKSIILIVVGADDIQTAFMYFFPAQRSSDDARYLNILWLIMHIPVYLIMYLTQLL